jgi:hypothetical protein
MADPRLTLHEQILLLALTERDGSLLNDTRFDVALGGAILAELLLNGYAELEPGEGHPLVTPTRRKRTGDPVLDEALVEIHTATRRTTPERWVRRFAESRDMHLEVARQLCRKKALEEHEGRVRLIFRRTVFVTVDPERHEEVLDGIRAAAFENGKVDVRDAALAALADAGSLIEAVFEEGAMKGRKDGLGERLETADPGPLGPELRAALVAVLAATHDALTEEGVTTS